MTVKYLLFNLFLFYWGYIVSFLSGFLASLCFAIGRLCLIGQSGDILPVLQSHLSDARLEKQINRGPTIRFMSEANSGATISDIPLRSTVLRVVGRAACFPAEK